MKKEFEVIAQIIQNNNAMKNFKKYIKIKMDSLQSTRNFNLSRLSQSKKIVLSTINQKKRFYKDINNRLKKAIDVSYQEKKSYLKTTYNSLMTFNPKEMLKKGYSILRRKDGVILKSKHELDKIRTFNAELQDGRINIKKSN